MVWHGSCLTDGMSIQETEWEKLCKLVADERNPQRLSELVDQLIEALDARRDVLRGSKATPKPASGSDPGNNKQ
jgi:hypothetical protein